MNSFMLLALFIQDDVFERAKKDNRRVLVQSGEKELDDLLRNDIRLRLKIRFDYELAKSGDAPALTILSADGNVVAREAVASFRGKDGTDAKKILALLEKHQSPSRKAKALFDEGLALAKESNKRVLLTFGLPG